MMRLVRLAWRYRVGCVGVLLLRTLLTVTVVAGLALVGLGIDVVRYAAHDGGGEPPPAPVYPFGLVPPADWSAVHTVIAIGVLIVVIAVLAAVINYAGTLLASTIIHRGLIVQLRSEVYNKLQRLSFRFFDSNDSGSIINRVTGDVMMVGQFISGVVLLTINLVLSMAISLGYMVHLHWQLTAACALPTLVLLGWWSGRFARQVKPAFYRSRELTDRLILTLSEHLHGVHVVKGFARQNEEIDKFKGANRDVRDQREWIFWKISLFQPIVVFLTQLNLIILLIYGGYLVIKGELAIGSGLVVFAGLLQQFSGQVTSLANVTSTIQVSITAAQRVFEVLDAPLEIDTKPDAVRLPEARGVVRFQGVTFGYNPDEPVLADIDFEAPAGSCVAIVGATGSGKSTLMSLIPRFYDPTRGSVYVDGHNVRDLDLDDLRRNIGLVFQESFLFSTTVAANIAFGHPHATREQVERAAKIAAAHEFIVELDDGYDTIIGEKGADLSGGQRQRLAIARAVLLEPSILILDDATAAIDPQTEHEILAAMDSAMKGRTTFVVAHRLSMLRRADLVVVLDKGRIVQAGTHDQLMATRGHYRRAAKLQTADAASKQALKETEHKHDGA